MALRGKLINTVASLALPPAPSWPQQHYPRTPGWPTMQSPAPQAPPQAPPQGQAPDAQPSGPAGFVPDAEYLATLAQAQFQRTQQINALETEGRTQREDTGEAIRRLLARVPDDRRQITAGANRQGLLFGGHHAKRLDDYQAQVTRSEGDQRLALQRGEEARAAVRQALLEGAPLEEAAARAEAIHRQVERDQQAAASNSLVLPDQPAVQAPRARVARPAVKPRRRRRRGR